jgi:hypothetical protein
MSYITLFLLPQLPFHSSDPPHHGHFRPTCPRRRTTAKRSIASSTPDWPHLPHRANLPRPLLQSKEALCRSQEPAQDQRPRDACRRKRNGRGNVWGALVAAAPRVGNSCLPLHARGAPGHHLPLHAEAERPPGCQPRGQQGGIGVMRIPFIGFTGLERKQLDYR